MKVRNFDFKKAKAVVDYEISPMDQMEVDHKFRSEFRKVVGSKVEDKARRDY